MNSEKDFKRDFKKDFKKDFKWYLQKDQKNSTFD